MNATPESADLLRADLSTADPQYPLGRFVPPQAVGANDRERWIGQVRELPGQLRAAVAGLNADQLATPYRDGGWTVLETVHHVADSHINAYVRQRLAMTEATPLVKPYDEAAWAKLPDCTMPPEVSLRLLEALHERWAGLLSRMSEREFARRYRHPASGEQDLQRMLAHYAWHGRHHTAQILALRQRRGW